MGKNVKDDFPFVDNIWSRHKGTLHIQNRSAIFYNLAVLVFTCTCDRVNTAPWEDGSPLMGLVFQGCDIQCRLRCL